MRRSIVAFSVMTGIAASGVFAQSAFASETTIQRESLVGVRVHSDCTNEDVQITAGDIQFVLVETSNRNRAIETFHVGTSGVTGVGVTSGAQYRYAETSIGQFNEGFDGTTLNVAVAHVTLVAGQGGGTGTTTLILVWRFDGENFQIDTEQSRITCTS